ncbi:putative leader peptide [Kineococcus aurantiacus]
MRSPLFLTTRRHVDLLRQSSALPPRR